MLLTLPIKLKWFDMIARKEKGEEYRDLTRYYKSRFEKFAAEPEFDIRFRAGYRKESPLMQCSVSLSIGGGREEWGALPGWRGYVLKINSVEVLHYGKFSNL